MVKGREQSGSIWARYLPGVFLLVVGTFFSADAGLFLFGTAVFILFYSRFMDMTMPPVLLFLFFFQWFFNQGQMLYAAIDGVKLSDNFLPSESIGRVVLLGMIGTSVFFLGILAFWRRVPRISFAQFKAFLQSINIKRLIAVYLGFYVLLMLGGGFVWLFLGLAQPLYMLTFFRWSIFFILFCTAFAQDKYKALVLALILFDFALGFLSFWASFKDVVYTSFIAYWVFYFRTSSLWRWTLPALVAFMIYVGALWSIIKQDYRDFLNLGTGAQVVYVERSEAVGKFIDLVTNADGDAISQGLDQLILRMSWVGAFNKVYNHVPARVPFENGKLWQDGVTRPFMPRLLFPDKVSLSDSEQLNHYSGLKVDEKNTSISLSAIAGSYVDFGEVWMHVPLLLFGMLCGWVYKKVFDWSPHPVIGHALSLPMIFVVNINEQSISRVVAAVILYFLVVWFVSRFLVKPMMRYIRPAPAVRRYTAIPLGLGNAS
jgi:hypothetical protein